MVDLEEGLDRLFRFRPLMAYGHTEHWRNGDHKFQGVSLFFSLFSFRYEALGGGAEMSFRGYREARVPEHAYTNHE